MTTNRRRRCSTRPAACWTTRSRLRRRIHRHPEIGLTLPRTQQTVLEALDGLGLKTRTGQKTTSVVATLEGGRPGPTMLLRADMDALPLQEDTGLPFASEVDGAMHACGHDTHVAMLVERRTACSSRGAATLPGRVVFMFQPGEEGYHGARVMIEEGLLEGDDQARRRVRAARGRPASGRRDRHPRRRRCCASGDTFQILVRGDGGHASAPHDCLDPIPIACEIVQAFQTLVTRRVNAFDPAVVTVAKIEAGTTRNIIPETASLLGTIRTVSERTRNNVLEGVKRVAEGVAAAHGAKVEVNLIRGYPVTVNHDAFADRVVRVATELLGAEHVQTMATPDHGQRGLLLRAPARDRRLRLPRHQARRGPRAAEPLQPHDRQRVRAPQRRRHARRRRARFPRRWGAPKWPPIPPRAFVAPRRSRGAPHHVPRLTPPRGSR